MSNRCEGPPFGACPDNRCDKTVKFTTYDLFLCQSCEKTRATAEQASGTSSEFKEACNKKTLKQQPKKLAGVKVVGSVGGKSSSDGAFSQIVSSDGTSGGGGSRQTPVEGHSTAVKTVMGDVNNSDIAIVTGSSSDFCVNELLSYVGFYRNKSNVDSLRQTLLSFYSSNDIGYAKKLLSQNYSSKLESCSLFAERRNSSTRSAHEAELDDIIGIFDILDSQNVLNTVSFVSVNLDNLPKFGPEEFNLAAVVDRQVRNEAAIKDMSAAIGQLNVVQAGSSVHEAVDVTSTCHELVKSMAADLQVKMDSFSASINARLEHLSSVCKSSLGAVHTRDSTSPSHGAHAAVDRQQNIVISGVKEDQDLSVWSQKVKEILKFVHGARVDIVDMFRLGRFNSGKTRPVLVKLRTVWDKRIIMNGCSRLKNFSQRGIFISSDEPLEVRRKQTFGRLKYRAESSNKIVSVTDDVLSIDGVAVFSLSAGYLNTSHG